MLGLNLPCLLILHCPKRGEAPAGLLMVKIGGDYLFWGPSSTGPIGTGLPLLYFLQHDINEGEKMAYSRIKDSTLILSFGPSRL